MAAIGQDLARLVADERWEALDDFIQGFPSNSHLTEAMVNDPEYAEVIAAQDPPTEKWTPRVSEWTLVTTLLAQILAATAGVQSAVVTSAGGKPKPFKPFPIPHTEVEAAKARQDKEDSSMLLRMAGFDPDEYL